MDPLAAAASSIASRNATIAWLRSSLTTANARIAQLEQQLAAAQQRPPPLRAAEEDKDEDKEEEDGVVAGVKLMQLWGTAAGQTAKGRSKGGRRSKTGRDIIQTASATILRTATPVANLAAESAGLGPCREGKGIGKNGEEGRPRHFLTGPQGSIKKFAAMAYHVTALAAGAAPPLLPGLGWSHRCHNSRCVNPAYGLWEAWVDNRGRDGCQGGEDCSHEPICVPFRCP